MDGLYITYNSMEDAFTADILYKGTISSGYFDWERKAPLFYICIKKFIEDFDTCWGSDSIWFKEYFKSPRAIAPINLIIWNNGDEND